MKLKSIKRIDSNSKRYDIQTKSENFYANGVLVHNSLIIWGTHNGELIHRTRGTFDATEMANGNEISFLKEKYYKFIPVVYNNPEYSILTEWQTKSNVIVINEVNEPTLSLIGIIHNETGKLTLQTELDYLAKCWNIERPNRYHYESISECIEDVDLWEGKEGVVLYSEDGQKLRKCKSGWYKSLHALATGVKTVRQVLDVFMESPKYTISEDFFNYIAQHKDYEIAEKCKDFCYEITSAYTTYETIFKNIEYNVTNYIKTLPTRKEQALQISKEYNGWAASLAFIILDNKEIDDKIVLTAMKNLLNIK